MSFLFHIFNLKKKCTQMYLLKNVLLLGFMQVNCCSLRTVEPRLSTSQIRSTKTNKQTNNMLNITPASTHSSLNLIMFIIAFFKYSL